MHWSLKDSVVEKTIPGTGELVGKTDYNTEIRETQISIASITG